VALDDSQSATGSLFWDDGESVDTYENGQYYMATYTVSSGRLTSTIVFNGYSEMSSLQMDDIRVMGIGSTVSMVTVNGASISTWSQDSSTLQLTLSSLGLSLTSSFTVEWD
jgi:hypothetical protein